VEFAEPIGHTVARSGERMEQARNLRRWSIAKKSRHPLSTPFERYRNVPHGDLSTAIWRDSKLLAEGGAKNEEIAKTFDDALL
jgi:hypothetical protein